MTAPRDGEPPERSGTCHIDDMPGERALTQALDGLENDVPDRVCRCIRWLRDPGKRWVRVPIGLLFILGAALSFLPVLGIELLPIGLLLLAVDVPALQKPVGRATLWLECQWNGLARRWRHRRS